MTLTAEAISPPQRHRSFDNVADLLHSLCDVPPSRVIWTPRPGTATEDDLILFVERYKRLCELVDGTLVEKTMGAGPDTGIDSVADFLHSLGDVPPFRVIWNPRPGTATEQDLLALVEGANRRLCELVDGTLVEKPLGFEESIIALNIASVVKAFVRSRKLGIVSGPDATLRMSKGNIRLPDVSFISATDLPGGKRPRVKVPKLPPTLAIEVVSETNTAAEIKKKLGEYFDSGSKLAWVVYPKSKTVAVYDEPSEQPKRTLNIDESLDGGSVLPGFSMSLAEVFDISDFE